MTNAWAMRPLVPAAVSASATAAGFAAANMLNDYAGVVWKSPASGASHQLVVDLGSAKPVDAALFFGCTSPSGSWTLTVEAADSADFATNLVAVATGIPFLAGATLPTHNRGVGWWSGDASVSRRYWRFTIGSLAGSAVTVARLAIGAKLTLARNFAFGGAWGVRDLGRVDYSAAGVLTRRRAAKLRTIGVVFPAVHKDEAETKVQPLIELAGAQEAVVLVTDPEPHAERQRRCWIGFLTGDLGTIWRAAQAWEWRANLVDLIPVPPAA